MPKLSIFCLWHYFFLGGFKTFLQTKFFAIKLNLYPCAFRMIIIACDWENWFLASDDQDRIINLLFLFHLYNFLISTQRTFSKGLQSQAITKDTICSNAFQSYYYTSIALVRCSGCWISEPSYPGAGY